MSNKTTDLFNRYVQEGRAPGTPSIKRYTRNDGTTALKSLNKWGKRKDWRDTEGGLAKAKEHAGVDTISEDVPCAEPITTDPNLPTSRLIGTNSIVNVFKKATPGQSPKELHEGLVSLAKRALPVAKRMVSRVSNAFSNKLGRSTKPATTTASNVVPIATATTKSPRIAAAFPQSVAPATATTSSSRLAAKFPKSATLAPTSSVSKGLLSRGAKVLGPLAVAYDVYDDRQQGKSWGQTAASVGGGLVGGALGTAAGSVAGPVGSFAGGYGGYEGGSRAGEWLYNRLTGSDSSPEVGPQLPSRNPSTTTAQRQQPTQTAPKPQVQQTTPKLQSNQPPKPAVQAQKPKSSSPNTIVTTKGGEYKVYNKDSDEAKSFRSEFAKNRRAGAKEFTWQGRKYSTAVAESNSLDESYDLAFDYQGKPQLAPTAGNLMMQAKGAFAYHDDVQNVMDVKAIKESIQKQFEQTVLEEDTEQLAEKCEILADMVEHALRTIDTIKESNLERDAWSEAQILKLESYIESVAKYIDNITEAGDVVADVVGVVVPAYKVTDPRTGKVRYVKGRTVKKKQRRKIGDGEDNDEPKGPLSV